MCSIIASLGMVLMAQAAADTSVLSLAQELVHCASVTPLDDGAMAAVAQAATAAGFTVETFIAEGPDGHRVHNLFAQMGPGRPALAFVGHVDVVPPGSAASWQWPPFAGIVKDGRLHGRGTADMKGAIAAFIHGAARYRRSVATLPGSIALMITGDEEEGSPQGMRALMAWCQKRDCLPLAALIGEASSEGYFGQGLRVGRRGSLNVFVDSSGVQGHVAYPQRARNPVHPLVRYLAAVQAHDWGPAEGIFPPTTLQVTQVHVDNTATNVIPQAARAHFNVRFNTRHSGSELTATLQEMARAISPDLRLRISISGEPYLCQATQLIAATARAVLEVTGHDPERNAGGGVSDGRFLHTACPVLEFGLVGDTIHQVDEYTDVADLERLAQVYERTLQYYLTP